MPCIIVLFILLHGHGGVSVPWRLCQPSAAELNRPMSGPERRIDSLPRRGHRRNRSSPPICRLARRPTAFDRSGLGSDRRREPAVESETGDRPNKRKSDATEAANDPRSSTDDGAATVVSGQVGSRSRVSLDIGRKNG